MQPIAVSAPREFVAIEQGLRTGTGITREAAGLAQLSPEEAMHLRTSAALLLELRLRREHPVLARVLAMVHARLAGERPEPLSRRETEALVALAGALSHGENDLLNHLHEVGAVPEAAWREIVLPHRQEVNREQRSRWRTLKWGVASLTANLSPMAVGLGVLAVASGPVGQVGAAVAGLLVGFGVVPRLQGFIERAGRREGALAGVDAAQGRAVASEAAVLVDRAATGAVFQAPGTSLIERLRSEVAVCDLLLASRHAAGGAAGEAGEQELVALAARYHKGIAALLEEAVRLDLPEGRLRERLTRLRAEVLTPDVLERSARREIATAVGPTRPRSPEDAVLHAERDRERATTNALRAMGELVQRTLPRLGGLGAALVPELTDVRPLAGGGFELRGRFDRGPLRVDSGTWRVRVGDDGRVDGRSLLLDVGEAAARDIATMAARRHADLLGERLQVANVEVRRIGTEARPRYVAFVRRPSGERPLRVIVTGAGLVEWEHLLVTEAPRRPIGGAS